MDVGKHTLQTKRHTQDCADTEDYVHMELYPTSDPQTHANTSTQQNSNVLSWVFPNNQEVYDLLILGGTQVTTFPYIVYYLQFLSFLCISVMNEAVAALHLFAVCLMNWIVCTGNQRAEDDHKDKRTHAHDGIPECNQLLIFQAL